MKKEIINIKNSKLAIYNDGNPKGETILFIHGFGSYSYTWEKMLPFLVNNYRIICVDLKGFGNSNCSKKDFENLSPLDNANLIRNLILQKDFKNITIVGHSLGGLVALLLALDEKIKDRIKRLNLIASSGYFYHLPDFIDELRSTVAKKIFIKYLSDEVLVRIVLNQLIHNHAEITTEDIENYAKPLKKKYARKAMIEAAKQIDLGNVAIKKHNLESLKIPILITCGADDTIMPLVDAEKITHFISHSKILILDDCGHAPQLEKSEEVAIALKAFIEEKLHVVTSIYSVGEYRNKKHSLLCLKENVDSAQSEKVEDLTGTVHGITLNAIGAGSDDVDFGSKTTIVNKKKAEEIIEKYITQGELVDGVIPLSFKTIDEK